MKLCYVFSDHAIYQASSVITIRGITEAKGSVSAEIIRSDRTLSCASADIGEDGRFEILISTPEASLEAARIRVFDSLGEEQINDVLFGELWICSGQSNMELPNSAQGECNEMLERIKGLPIRIYFQEYGSSDEFSITPEYTYNGWWSVSDDSEKWKRPSALATAFALDIYEKIKSDGKEIPVGVIDVCWGGTPLRSWLPVDVLTTDERILTYLRAINQEIDEEKWNKRPVLSQQAAAQFNRRIAPIIGVKARGILWYQGECDAWDEPGHEIYAHMYKIYHDTYARIFAKDPDNFPLVASLCYPWVYGESGESRLSYVNSALVDAASAIGGEMSFVPVADLPAVWADVQGNHPIHPTHKYKLAERFSDIVYANVYDKSGILQKIPATLESTEICGSKILLHFKNVGYGLYTSDDRPIRCLYIAGEDEYYVPATANIISDDTLEVFHPYLENPRHVALCWSDHELGFNLFGGDYPVAPFATNKRKGEIIHIQAKPFINHDVDSVWIWDEPTASSYFRPVWEALADSGICYDNAFVQKGHARSVFIYSDEKSFGAKVRSYPFNELDLERYSGMYIDLHHRAPISGRITAVYDGEEVTLDMISRGEISCYYERFFVDLSTLSKSGIKELRFTFEADTDKNIHRFVNIGEITLVPEKSEKKI